MQHFLKQPARAARARVVTAQLLESTPCHGARFAGRVSRAAQKGIRGDVYLRARKQKSAPNFFDFMTLSPHMRFDERSGADGDAPRTFRSRCTGGSRRIQPSRSF